MNQLKKTSTVSRSNVSRVRSTPHKQKAHVGTAANDLLLESKKLVNELYQDGLDKINVAEDQIKQYSDHMLHTVQKNPLASVLIAGGIGFVLSRIFSK